MSFKIKPKLFFGTLLVLSLAFAIQTFAQDESSIFENYSSLYSSKQPVLENWVSSNSEATIMGTINIGIPISTIQQLGQAKTPQEKRMVWLNNNGGAIGMTNNLIGYLYLPTASGVEYIAGLKNTLLGRPAYAQSTGATGLQPILPLWRGFRNIIYILSSIFFITIGILIILRVKISPQAVVTVQNAIPQLIITLVLVTFSYAIAGLVIDILQLLQSLITAMLFSVEGRPLTDNLFKGLFGSNIGAINSNFQQMTTRGMGLVGDLTARAAPVEYFLLFPLLIGAVITVLTAGTGVTAGIGIAGIGSALILLIFMILMLVWMFKFYMGALKCYVTAIFKIIIAPLEIAMGSFPGSKAGFSSWIWDLIANLAVFPISILFLTLANMIIDHSANLWAPSIMTTGLQGVVGNVVTLGNIVGFAIGIASISLVSKLPDLIPQLIFAIKPSPWGQAIGQSLSAVDKIAATAAWQGTNMGLQSVATGSGGRKVTDLLNKIPGVTVTTGQVQSAAGKVKAAHNTLGGFEGQKFT